MIRLIDDFKKVIEEDKKIKLIWDEYQDAINKRNEYYNKIVTELNDNRTKLQEEYGLKGYNYSKPLDDYIDNKLNSHYCFKSVFLNRPSAKELSVIEEITGCKYVGESFENNSNVFYFKLPQIITYELP